MDNQITSVFDSEKTQSTLSTVFVSNGCINNHDLNSAIITEIKTNKELQYQAMNKRMSPSDIVWRALVVIANQCLTEDYSRKYTASLPHLEHWLAMYNGNIKESVEYVERL